MVLEEPRKSLDCVGKTASESGWKDAAVFVLIVAGWRTDRRKWPHAWPPAAQTCAAGGHACGAPLLHAAVKNVEKIDLLVAAALGRSR